MYKSTLLATVRYAAYVADGAYLANPQLADIEFRGVAIALYLLTDGYLEMTKTDDIIVVSDDVAEHDLITCEVGTRNIIIRDEQNLDRLLRLI